VDKNRAVMRGGASHNRAQSHGGARPPSSLPPLLAVARLRAQAQALELLYLRQAENFRPHNAHDREGYGGGRGVERPEKSPNVQARRR